MECYLAIKKNETPPFAVTWRSLEIIILSEVRQKEKDKHHIISLISGNLQKMIPMNLFTKQTHKNCGMSYGYQKGKRRRH